MSECEYGCSGPANFKLKIGKWCCSKSSNGCSAVKAKKKRAYLDKYGVDNPRKSEEVNRKVRETNLSKYGSEYIVTSQMFKQKASKTLKQNYGVSNPSFSEEIQERKRQTYLDRLGVDHWTKDEGLMNQQRQRNLESFGKEHWFSTDEFQSKLKATLLERYGVDNPGKYEEFRQKMIFTCEVKYGKNRCKNVSNGETKWLDEQGIDHRQKGVTGKSGKTYFVDGLDGDTVYEFLGIFWHGHPVYFDQTDVNRVTKKTYGELYQNTIDRINDIQNAGYTVIAVWETGEPFRGTNNESNI